MRAAVVSVPGVPEIGEFREPEPAGDAVVLDVVAAAVNNFDRQLAAGTHPLSPAAYPAVAGYDGVGRTHDGRLVYFHSPLAPFGSMAERTLVRTARLIELPDATDPVVAAALGAGLAGWLPLSWRARLAAGECVAVLGAAGVAGSIAVQAAVLLGAGRVVAVVRGGEQADRARALGAHAVVDTNAHADLAGALRAAAPDGFHVIVDYLWGPTLAAAVRNAAPGARVVNVGGVSGDLTELSGAALRGRGVDLLGFAGHLVPRQLRVDNYLQQVALAGQGRLDVPIACSSLDAVEKAWTDPPAMTRTVLLP